MDKEFTAKIAWREVITPSNNIFSLNLKEIWNYRDLLMIWVKRDISAIYKQTILGPAWFFLQPVLTTIAYIIIFSRIGKLSTNGLPPSLFYLSGIILWAFFSDCLVKISLFLKENSPIFSKVYFPRLIIPLSNVVTNFVKFTIQFLLFLILYFFYYWTTDSIRPSALLLLLPFLLLAVSILGFGAGILVASMTIRYKDLSHLITFGIQLMMFVSPVFFPLSKMDKGFYRTLILANPMSGLIEAFRFIFTGKGYLNWSLIGYDLSVIGLLLFLGIILFNYTEKSFIDTI